MNPNTGELEPGDIIRLEGRPYRVDMVNFSRAYCIPHPFELGRANGVNIGPNSIVSMIHDSHGQPKKAERADDTMTTDAAIDTNDIATSVHDQEIAKMQTAKRGAKLPIKKTTDQKVKAAAAGAKPGVKLSTLTKGTKAKAVKDEAKRAAKEAATEKRHEAEAARKSAKAAKIEAKKEARAKKLATPMSNKNDKGRVRAGQGTQPCKCGCGTQVSRHFAQGHDARFKGWIKKLERGEMKLTDPTVAGIRSQYKWVKLDDGSGGVVPTTDYTGEPYTRG